MFLSPTRVLSWFGSNAFSLEVSKNKISVTELTLGSYTLNSQHHSSRACPWAVHPVIEVTSFLTKLLCLKNDRLLLTDLWVCFSVRWIEPKTHFSMFNHAEYLLEDRKSPACVPGITITLCSGKQGTSRLMVLQGCTHAMPALPSLSCVRNIFWLLLACQALSRQALGRQWWQRSAQSCLQSFPAGEPGQIDKHLWYTVMPAHLWEHQRLLPSDGHVRRGRPVWRSRAAGGRQTRGTREGGDCRRRGRTWALAFQVMLRNSILSQGQGTMEWVYQPRVSESAFCLHCREWTGWW